MLRLLVNFFVVAGRVAVEVVVEDDPDPAAPAAVAVAVPLELDERCILVLEGTAVVLEVDGPCSDVLGAACEVEMDWEVPAAGGAGPDGVAIVSDGACASEGSTVSGTALLLCSSSTDVSDPAGRAASPAARSDAAAAGGSGVCPALSLGDCASSPTCCLSVSFVAVFAA